MKSQVAKQQIGLKTFHKKIAVYLWVQQFGCEDSKESNNLMRFQRNRNSNGVANVIGDYYASKY